ncbi:MAG: pyruvate, phosphate dikinase [Rubricoccaceae bacterium]|nr:pyruvate, phosphate dikinase [Rubricoccaceae bacterium]
MTQFVYRFGNGFADGNKDLRHLLGGKGANLAEMAATGLPVPPGFTITTETCELVLGGDGTWPDGLVGAIQSGLEHVESAMGLSFGDPQNPLLVSVRSGAAVSMPGMMDTVLNLGLNDTVVEGLARKMNNERFALDAYRRFIDMFGDVVMGVHHGHFEQALAKLKDARGVTEDVDLDADALLELVESYKDIYKKHVGEAFPDRPQTQLSHAIDAVFNSWNSERAVKYRRINHITGLKGTAVNVQAMVFGNLGPGSGTGVCFTRNPSTGDRELYGEFLPNAQGEDVVAGIRTPLPISEMTKTFPQAYDQLVGTAERLERSYRNMQDIEFTVQEGELYLLQTRNGKRTGSAAVKIAVDLVEEGLVSESEALKDLVEPRHIEGLLHPRFADNTDYADRVVGTGLPASPGAAVGRVVFSAEEAEVWREQGEHVILVRVETSPEDVGGMHASEGILTARGGMTSHAAVVARGWGKPCVAGCGDIQIDYDRNHFFSNGTTVNKGDWISINGTTGEVVIGREELVPPEMTGDVEEVLAWADKYRRLKVRTNADTPSDAAQAVKMGAEGIGLCRTEHMFFEGDRIHAVRRMILAETRDEREKALAELLPHQRTDFEGIFRAMDGKPVTIRLLDPPLHEFLPSDDEGLAQLAKRENKSVEEVSRRLESLEEFNPMLGHRGCRLGIIYPEIIAMQARALFEAAVTVAEDGVEVLPEIMVPLIGSKSELVHQRQLIEDVAESVFEEQGNRIRYLVGTMIEVPRAALLADEIAEAADFFSFGTNDLTQMTFGFSRDDAGKFLPHYVEHGLLDDDPFRALDQNGVGKLVAWATERGRATKKDLKVGVCGEHGGEPTSVAFFDRAGLDYVSCSPFRVPVARLAAAQATLKDR